ncbi:MAG: UDP-N-acetylglucosamine--N-acetylmuramyl-(pentapeptide) pyrophosphoryl-undecaprenol N-acetylglucosamine transferase [Leptospira sp.]|nr:UDP-N-acetylglucosamine--N-acetylmuramyl-(pentapeptide) pyrophosphoryl-undecaprenol N-acetylglucosamine transferase [Leptospira sp.]
MRSVVIAAGGTGGHISPGVALAEILAEKKDLFHIESLFIYSLVRNANNPDLKNPPCPVIWHNSPRIALRNFLFFPVLFSLNFVRCALDFSRRQVDCVIAMGGYSTLPAILYAIIFRKRLFLCEQNCIIGKVTKYFQSFADKIAFSFPPENFSRLKENYKVIGNPIRKKIIPLVSIKFSKPLPEQKKNKLNVLVMGGSQGARQINNMVLNVMEHTDISRQFNFRLLTGSSLYEEAKAKTSGDADLISYSDDMKSHYEWANLVIARSGAGVLSECAAFAIPLILIPYPFASDNHQEANASYFEKEGAALVILQKDEDPTRLTKILLEISGNLEILNQASMKSLSCARINAAYETLRFFFEENKSISELKN